MNDKKDLPIWTDDECNKWIRKMFINGLSIGFASGCFFSSVLTLLLK